MRPARIITVVVFAAAVAITGCSTNPTASNPAAAAPATSRPAAAIPAPTPTAPRPPTTRTTTPAPPQPSPPTPERPAWSTGPQVTAVTDPTTQLTGFRAARHAGFDRVVFQFHGRVPGYDVRYVPALSQDPSGQPIPLRGGAVLRVVLRHASTSPGPGGGPIPLFVGVLTADLPSLKQLKVAGDFEGHLSFGLGLDHRVVFRVLTLTGPSRVVIDVAHSPAPSPPFPGIWDVRTWEEAQKLQDAVEQGHQPWRCGPDRLVALYAEQVLHEAEPVIRRVDTATFTVTRPGDGVVATISVTQPFKGKPCGIWVITSVTKSP